jgi:hypothetical protein
VVASTAPVPQQGQFNGDASDALTTVLRIPFHVFRDNQCLRALKVVAHKPHWMHRQTQTAPRRSRRTSPRHLPQFRRTFDLSRATIQGQRRAYS